MRLLGSPTPSPSGRPLPFSQAVRSGDLVFISGQVPLIDGTIVGTTIAAQTDCVFDNLETQLALAGCTLSDVVKVTAWITDRDDFEAFNLAYAARFGDHRPARSTLVSALALAGARVEIEVIAERAAD